LPKNDQFLKWWNEVRGEFGIAGTDDPGWQTSEVKNEMFVEFWDGVHEIDLLYLSGYSGPNIW
jgi:hypothetical protein